jgi:hypothetical protein
VTVRTFRHRNQARARGPGPRPPQAAHALVDGNTRLGWLATVVFLDLNGFAPELSDDAAFELVMDVAAGSAEG